MDLLCRATLALVFCISIVCLFLISIVAENSGTELLRELYLSRRLSPGECDLLRPSKRTRLKDGSRSLPTSPKTEKALSLRRILLLDGRISAAEFEILNSPCTLSWRNIAKDRAITWLRSWKSPFRRGNPVTQVSQTAELLERILVYVPHQDLALNVPRTCKRFRDATKTSTCLRRRLFLEPDRRCSQQTLLPLEMKGSSFGLVPSRPSSRYVSLYGLARIPPSDFDRVFVKRLKAYPELQDVMIAQPPVHSAKLEVHYSGCIGVESLIMSSNTDRGITVGDVLSGMDAIFKSLADHVGMQDTKPCWVELKMQDVAGDT